MIDCAVLVVCVCCALAYRQRLYWLWWDCVLRLRAALEKQGHDAILVAANLEGHERFLHMLAYLNGFVAFVWSCQETWNLQSTPLDSTMGQSLGAS